MQHLRHGPPPLFASHPRCLAAHRFIGSRLAGSRCCRGAVPLLGSGPAHIAHRESDGVLAISRAHVSMRDPVRRARGPSRVERLAGSRGSGLGEAAGVQPLLMCTYGWCGPKTNVLQRRSDGIQLVTEHTFDARAQQGAPGRRQECAGSTGQGKAHTGSASRAPQGSGVRCMQRCAYPGPTPEDEDDAPCSARRTGSAGPAGPPSLARRSGFMPG